MADLSWGDLTPAQQEIVRGLAGLPDGGGLSWEALCSRYVALSRARALAALQDEGLVEAAGPDRFRLTPLGRKVWEQRG